MPGSLLQLPAEGGRILSGDHLEVLPRLPDGVVDLTVTSPPYDTLRDYHGYALDVEALGRQLLRVTSPGGVCVWVVGDSLDGGRSLTSFRQTIAFQEMGWRVHDVMVFLKRNTPFPRRGAYTNCWELMVVLSKGRPRVFNPLTKVNKEEGTSIRFAPTGTRADGVRRYKEGRRRREGVRTNAWTYSVGYGNTSRDKSAFLHPAAFPERLAADHVLSWTNRGDLVLDPMCGSGTTLKAAHGLGRRFLGIDISPAYVRIAADRVRSGDYSEYGPDA